MTAQPEPTDSEAPRAKRKPREKPRYDIAALQAATA